jgi:hypothetical protein
MAGFVNPNTCRRLEMLQYDQTLFVGAPRGAGLRKTVDLITGKLRRLGDFVATVCSMLAAATARSRAFWVRTFAKCMASTCRRRISNGFAMR